MKSRAIKSKYNNKASIRSYVSDKDISLRVYNPCDREISATAWFAESQFLKFVLACLDFLGPEALRKVAEKCDKLLEDKK